jgi:hypothetical protein
MSSSVQGSGIENSAFNSQAGGEPSGNPERNGEASNPDPFLGGTRTGSIQQEGAIHADESVSMLSEFKQGFAYERQILQDRRLGCTDVALLQFYARKDSRLRAAELMCSTLIATISESDLPCIGNLGLALSYLIISENHNELMDCWKDITTAVNEVRNYLKDKSAEQLKRERDMTNRTRAEADEARFRANEAQFRENIARSQAVVAERKTHSWLWRIFH